MAQDNNKKQRGFLPALIGEVTPAKVSGLTYSLSVIAIVVFSLIFSIIIGIAGYGGQESLLESDGYLYVSYLLAPISFALVALCILRVSNSSVKRELSAQKCQGKYYFIAILLQIGLLSFSELNTLFLRFLEKFGYVDDELVLPSVDGFGFVGVLLVVAVLPAIFEEIIFRGFLLRGLKSFGEVGAILLCGGLFALYHQNPAQTLYQFCCGAAFALVALRAGSVLPTVVSHFFNNALIVTLYKYGITVFPKPVFVIVLCVSIACLLFSLAWLIFFDDKKEKCGFDGSKQDVVERKSFWTFSSMGIAVCALIWIVTLISGL